MYINVKCAKVILCTILIDLTFLFSFFFLFVFVFGSTGADWRSRATAIAASSALIYPSTQRGVEIPEKIRRQQSLFADLGRGMAGEGPKKGGLYRRVPTS